MYKPLPKGAKIIFAEYDKGITSIEDLAKKTGYAKRTIYGYLYEFGKTNKRTLWFDNSYISNKTKEIIKQIDKGVSGTVISKKFNVSRQWVSKLKKKRLQGVYCDKEID